MKKQRIADVFGQVDDRFIEEAAPEIKKRKKLVWTRWATIAACLVIIVGGVFIWKNIGNENDEMYEDTVAYGFKMNDCDYFPISFEERIRYELVPQEAMGLTPENTYKITRDDLGEVMGTVEDCSDESLIGSTVYHFATFPDFDSICIVEYNGEYSFYCSDGMYIDLEVGGSSDVVLEAYNMPESVTKIIVRSGELETLMTLDDAETIAAICELMSGKENVGYEAHEKLYAQLWYNTYGNDDVYYDETSGSMIYREAQNDPPEPVIYTDDDGNKVTYYESGTEDYYKAHDLWSEDEREVIFTTDRGFELYMNYRPSISAISFYSGYYRLTESEAKEMNSLLGVE